MTTKNANRCITVTYSETAQWPWLFWNWDLNFDIRNDSTICSALNSSDDYELNRLPLASCYQRFATNHQHKSIPTITLHDLKPLIKGMLLLQSIWGTVTYGLSQVSTSYWMYSTKYPMIIFWGQWHSLIYAEDTEHGQCIKQDEKE